MPDLLDEELLTLARLAEVCDFLDAPTKGGRRLFLWRAQKYGRHGVFLEVVKPGAALKSSVAAVKRWLVGCEVAGQAAERERSFPRPSSQGYDAAKGEIFTAENAEGAKGRERGLVEVANPPSQGFGATGRVIGVPRGGRLSVEERVAAAKGALALM